MSYPNRIEELSQVLVEAVDDVIFVVGRDGRYQMFNERGLKPFGYTPDQLIGKTPREAFGDAVGERFESNNARVVAEGKPVQFEEWFTLADRTRCYSTVLTPIFDEGGGVKAVVGIGRDVTQLKRMTEELETYTQEMESIIERRVRYERLVTELTQEAIKRQTLADFLASVVERVGTMLGISRSYIIEYDAHRQRITCTHEWNAPGIAPTKELMQDLPADVMAWASGELTAGRIVCFADARLAEDEVFRALMERDQIKSVLLVPIFTFGNPFGCIGFDECLLHRRWEEMDVELLRSVGRIIAQTVERRRLENEMLRTERIAATGRLAASVAHEINNPLQAIMLHLEAVRDHVDRKRQHNLDFVVEGLQRIAKIVSRLLGLHRNVKKSEPVDVTRTLSESYRLVANQLTIKNCDVRWKLAEALPPVMGDAEQLHQVFLNLILNASDSMAEGGMLALATGIEQGFVVVEVEDNGEGIDEESLPYLFEPFFSTKERAGTGLGLFVSHAIVSDHGGRIEVKSKKGKGTLIRVLLPVGRASATVAR